MPELPQELIDRFVDEFCESTENLQTLSLIGRRWLHRARYHLFRCITLTPQDSQEIGEYYTELKRRVSAIERNEGSCYYPFLPSDEKLLHSLFAEDPQRQISFISSISDTLCYVRYLRLESHILLGGERSVSANEYFERWLGFGNVPQRKARWEAVDLPWGHCAGIHVLPFRSLRFLYIRWSIFSWTPPAYLEENNLEAQKNPAQWPAYQLAMFIKCNANTLVHLGIDEYPGFQPHQYTSTCKADALLDLLAKNAPNLQSLSLGGPMLPFVDFSEDSYTTPFRVQRLPMYPSGEEVPYAFLNPANSNSVDDPLNTPSGLTLKRLSLRNFDLESMLLLEDVLLNNGVLSAETTKYLAFAGMPKDFDYMLLFSTSCHSLTHLTLEVDQSTSHLRLPFHFFPNLKYLQFMIDQTTYTTSGYVQNLVRSLSHPTPGKNKSEFTPYTLRLLHFALGQRIHEAIARQYLEHTSIDELLLTLVELVLPDSSIMGNVKVELVTVDVPENALAAALPITFQTGCLHSGKTDEWWDEPSCS